MKSRVTVYVISGERSVHRLERDARKNCHCVICFLHHGQSLLAEGVEGFGLELGPFSSCNSSTSGSRYEVACAFMYYGLYTLAGS
jgi:hypothetical protein